MKKRIGLMGGTFNPVHNGHLLLAQEAREQYELDEVWFLPARRPPHKDKGELPKDEIRLKMLQLAVEKNPAFAISMLEMQRTEEQTYTYDTMVELKEKYPEIEFYFIIGADSLFYMHKWYQYEKLLQGMIFLVAPRGGKDQGTEEMKKIIEKYKREYQANIGIIQMPLIEISSTDLREKRKAGKSIKYYLPDSVEAYIRECHIYREEHINVINRGFDEN